MDARDLGLLTQRSLAPLLERDADELLAVSGQGLGFFGDVFKLPFPDAKYDEVLRPL